MNSFAKTLFERLDNNLDYCAREIRNGVFSKYRDMPWTHDQYQILRPLIRKELESLVYSMLENLDNVGAVLPEGSGVLGYRIKAVPFDEAAAEQSQELVAKAEIDIRDGNDDYCAMWWDYLHAKTVSAEK